jgi:hypothetical protein
MPPTVPHLPVGLSIPEHEYDDLSNWMMDSSFDWISSKLEFSASDVLELERRNPTDIYAGVPLQDKIDFFDGLEEVGITDSTHSAHQNHSVQSPTTTNDVFTSSYGTALTITSSFAKEIDISGNGSYFAYL